MNDAARFYSLVHWFRSIGVCWLCGLDGAIAMVEREAGRAWAPKDERVCGETDRHGRTCRQIAELHWSDRPVAPKPPTLAPARTATKG